MEELPAEPVQEETAGSCSILIAEDHEVNQFLFKTILESLGHTVSVANNGREAVEAVKADGFDVIFMDVQMPEMNGYEATEHIRELGIETPIIAATASAVKEEREKCAAVGMDDLLIKPFKKGDVLPLLQKWLPGKAAGGPGPEPTEPAADMEEIEEPGDLEEPEEMLEIVEPEGGYRYSGAGMENNTANVEAAAPEPVSTNSSVAEADLDLNSEIFNLEEATAAFMGKRDIVFRVLRSFIKKVEGQIPVMEEALAAGDLETLRGEAHSIKGGGLNLSVIRLGNKGKDLEDASREGRSEDAARYFEELKTLYAELADHVAPLL